MISSYGINLENLEEDKYSNNGIIRCMVQSLYVGNQNVSYIVSGQYGRSVPDKSLYHVSADNKIHMLQTYAGTKVLKFYLEGLVTKNLNFIKFNELW